MKIDPDFTADEIYDHWYLIKSYGELFAITVEEEDWLCILQGEDKPPIFVHSEYTYSEPYDYGNGDRAIFYFNRESDINSVYDREVNDVCQYRPLDYLSDADTKTPLRHGHYCLMLEVMRQLDYGH